jgi:hypothetical protein
MNAYSQAGAAVPSWVTVNVMPAMVAVPVRGPAFVLAAATASTVPLPSPQGLGRLSSGTTVSQLPLPSKAHLQPVGANTRTSTADGCAWNDRAVGEIELAQVTGPSWTMYVDLVESNE